MEISITISSPFTRIVPDDNIKIDMSVKGVALSDAHLFGDMRPAILAVLDSYIDAAKLDVDTTRDLKTEVRTLVYGEDA